MISAGVCRLVVFPLQAQMSSPDPTTAAGGRRAAVAAMLDVTKSGLLQELSRVHQTAWTVGLQVEGCNRSVCDAIQLIISGDKVRLSAAAVTAGSKSWPSLGFVAVICKSELH